MPIEEIKGQAVSEDAEKLPNEFKDLLDGLETLSLPADALKQLRQQQLMEEVDGEQNPTDTQKLSQLTGK